MAAFYERVNKHHPPDPGTLGWQKRNARHCFRRTRSQRSCRAAFFKHFGEGQDMKLLFEPHHRSHAAAAFFLSPMEEALVFVVDGSGDSHCATLWRGEKADLSSRSCTAVEIPTPSLGWFYAAMTEYLGFDAYDGEYKVMGLAAYGRPNETFRKKLDDVVRPGPLGWDYALDPRFIHHGKHTYSHRFTDELAEHIGLPPRMGPKPLEKVHEDLAFETQHAARGAVRCASFATWAKQTGIKNLVRVGGGVALNVKMNSRIHREGLFDDLFIFPIPSDSGCGLGAAIAHGVARRPAASDPQALRHVLPRPENMTRYNELELQLSSCGLAYREARGPLPEPVAELLEQGNIVAWVQGALEGGPPTRSAARSILADPREYRVRAIG